jgi:hypothetical protein
VPRLIACALVGSLVLVALAPAAPVPQHLMKHPPVYYFPTKVGTLLEYEEPGRNLTMLVTAVADRGGAKVVSVGQVHIDESVTPLMKVAVTGTSLARIERGGCKLDTPEAWLQLPAERDQCWDYPTGDATLPVRPVSRQRTIGVKDITVPAGTFRCVGVSSYHNGHTLTCWYAPDVGLVKTEAATWTEVLKSFTPPKD